MSLKKEITMKTILIINAGSSSMKWQVTQMPSEEVLVSGVFERIGHDDCIVKSEYPNGTKRSTVASGISDHQEAINQMFEELLSEGVISDISEIDGIGHRVVAGGEYFSTSALVGDDELEKIIEVAHLAPLHNPIQARVITNFKKMIPTADNVAVFDTSYFSELPEKNRLYSIKKDYYEKYGIRKYGAHGTSHRYIAQRAADLLGKDLSEVKLVTCHLGNGASISAIDGGVAIDTSMGYTPLSGVTMGTRSGDLDPTLIGVLMEKEKMDFGDVLFELSNKSGLLGISGVSNDLRDLEDAAADGNTDAQLALDIFEDRVIKYIGSYLATLNGADAIVFSAGIGENGIGIRQNILRNFEYAGCKVCKESNNVRGEERIISTNKSSLIAIVIPTDEEKMIASDTYMLMKK